MNTLATAPARFVKTIAHEIKSFASHYPQGLAIYLLVGGALFAGVWLSLFVFMIIVSPPGVVPTGPIPGVDMTTLLSAILGIPILGVTLFAFPGLLFHDGR